MLDPPPRGLRGLRARIDRERVRGRRLQFVQTVAAATLLAVVLGWSVTASRDRYPAPPELALARLSLGLNPPPTEPLTVAEHRRSDTAVQRVPLAGDEVVFYLVASVRGPKSGEN